MRQQLPSLATDSFDSRFTKPESLNQVFPRGGMNVTYP